jgi:hypothetical protein
MHIPTSSIVGLFAIAAATNALSFPDLRGGLAVRAAPNGGKQGASQQGGAGKTSGVEAPASSGRPAGSQGGGKSTANAPESGGKGAGSPAGDDASQKPATGGVPNQGQGNAAGPPKGGSSPPAARPSPPVETPPAPSQGNNKPADQSPRETPKPTHSSGHDADAATPMSEGRQQGNAHNGATNAVAPGAGGDQLCLYVYR